MISLFQQVKSQVAARQAAERYGVQISRNGMARCIFHQDQHPSMKIDERYYCFACHETGDVIDLTAKLFGLSPYEAAKKLAEDFGIGPQPPGQSLSVAKKASALSEYQEEQRILSLLIHYERFLKKTRDRFAPSMTDTETWDELFVQTIWHLSAVDFAINCLFSADPHERKDMVDYIWQTNADSIIATILKNEFPEVTCYARKANAAA